jgi:hypothetical protein
VFINAVGIAVPPLADDNAASPTSGLTYVPGSGTLTSAVFAGTASSARYADLAENYLADATYHPGTVLEFGGQQEVTTTTHSYSTRVAGVVSTNPAYLMNSELIGEHAVGVALTGRVPCKVIGKIVKGDRLVSSDIPGVAQVMTDDQYKPGSIIGKAVEEYDSDQPGIITVAVGKN